MSKTLRKMFLNINGAEKMVVFDPEENLADFLRRLGFTSVKLGCGTGVCGSCTVLLDGDPVRSCTKKMRSVGEYSKIETLEGLGTPGNLHPIQQAFITYCAVQCGYCSPGFIMSTKGLLDKNPNPTRVEVRDWFTKHRNICRCTGYKQIIDAVMAAAAVMRGEKTMDDIIFHIPEDGNIYSSNLPRPDATMLGKVTGLTDYGIDLADKMPEGTLHLAVVQTDVHHGRVIAIDAGEAEKEEGFVRLITAKDITDAGGTNRLVNMIAGGSRTYADGLEHPVICEGHIVYSGDVVAVVAATGYAAARRAAAKVKVEVEELPVASNYEEAVAPGAPQLHPEVKDSPLYVSEIPNVYVEQPLYKGEDTREVFKKSAVVVEGSFATTRQPHLTIEPEVGQAYYDEDGTLVIQYKSQNMYATMASIYDAIGVEKDKLRIVLNNTGGSFGFTMSAQFPALVGACTKVTGRPVSLIMNYREFNRYSGKRLPINVNSRFACDDRGKLTGIEFHLGGDHGCYSEMSHSIASKMSRFFGYPYNVPNSRGLVQIAFTNNNFGIAFRAYGSPQVYTCSEQMMDMLAKKLGMDPFEFRYINVAHKGDTCPNSVPYREYPMQEMMDEMRAVYLDAKKRAEQESTPEHRRGVGIAWGGYHVGKCPDHAELDLELNPDGSVTNYNCWQEMGQGADIGTLTHTYTALRPLGLTIDQIHLKMNDTAIAPDCGPTSASRSHHVVGQCTQDAANKLLAAMRKEDGTYRTYDEMVAEGIPTRYRGEGHDIDTWADIDPDTGEGYGAFAQNYMLFIAEVDVETATGKTKVLAMHCNADIGVVGNMQAVLGQAYSGMAHSIGYALTEDYRYDKKYDNMAGCGVPTANDIPDDKLFDVRFHVTPREQGPFGSTGCSEGFQSAGHAAVLNALADATGVRIYTLPATPAKVRAALDEIAAGGQKPQRKWNLGCELYSRLDELRAHPVKKN